MFTCANLNECKKKVKLTKAVDDGRMALRVHPSSTDSAANVVPMQLASQDDNAIASIAKLTCQFNQADSYTVENASIDIAAYAQMYGGWNKILRLLFIADHSPSRLKVEALKTVRRSSSCSVNSSTSATISAIFSV